jgi:phosphomannomutase/phosphoglucomutase
MIINPFIFRNYDIRGKVGEDLDAAKVEALGKAYGTLLNRRKIKQAVVGHDCRLSGDEFQTAFVKGLITTGVDVIDLGMIMTQMMYFAQYYFQTNGGAILTASHNPAQYNGFKLAIGYSKTTEQDEVQELKHYTIDENYYVSDKPGTVTKADITEAYYNDILKRVHITKKFKVVIDSRNGTTGMYMPEILKRAGCEIIELNTRVDGSFPSGTPDPTDAHIIENLAKVVVENKADIGFAYDGDGDRIGLTDEKGHVMWNDVIVAIYAQEILERFPKSKIIYNTLCTQLVPNVIKQAGGIPIIWKTGHAFIKSKIAEEKAAFGGELSGHFFFNDNAYGHDDGAYATLRILEILEQKNKTLSEIYESYPKYISSPEIKIGCPDDKKIAIVKQISEQFKKDFKGAQITDDSVIPGDDGARADFEDGMMIFRYSQNGPYVTMKFEAKDEDTYLQRKKYIRRMLENYPDMIWKDELCVNLDALN